MSVEGADVAITQVRLSHTSLLLWMMMMVVDGDAADGNADEQMMVPGYGEELEMGFNATSPSAIANSARTNITESLQQGTLMWSTSLRPIYANGPQLICTHYVEKEIC